MAQDFRFASLRGRFSLNSHPSPYLCGTEGPGAASSVVKIIRTANVDVSAHDNTHKIDNTPGSSNKTPKNTILLEEKSGKNKIATNGKQSSHPNNGRTDKHEEYEDAIKMIPYTSVPCQLFPIEEPFNTLFFRLQEQLGLHGYPRSLNNGTGETSLGAWDGFASETQRRINNTLHRYLGKTLYVLVRSNVVRLHM